MTDIASMSNEDLLKEVDGLANSTYVATGFAVELSRRLRTVMAERDAAEAKTLENVAKALAGIAQKASAERETEAAVVVLGQTAKLFFTLATAARSRQDATLKARASSMGVE